MATYTVSKPMCDNYWPAFYGNLEEITQKNTNYRRVLATTATMQLVAMSLAPGESIGFERHPYITQFIRVEGGIGVAVVGEASYALAQDMAIIVPPDVKHNITNTSPNLYLKLYTIYSPPEHNPDRVDIVKPN